MVTPTGRVIDLPDNLCWRFTRKRMDEEIAAGRIWFGIDGNGVPRKKTYLSESEGRNLWTWWPNVEVGHTQEATKEVKNIFGNAALFDYPKPLRLIQRIMQIATDKDSIILDSFAGSGTTAHAVMNMNKVDGGHRRFVLIEMEDYADSITAERVKRVIDGYGESGKKVEGTGGGFGFYELGESLFLENENLNPTVDVEDIRKYIWYMETRTTYAEKVSDEKFLLGSVMETAYYFIYEKENMTVLDRKFLSEIRTKAEHYVIYADTCTISEEKLLRYNITFKKIPRDIVKL